MPWKYLPNAAFRDTVKSHKRGINPSPPQLIVGHLEASPVGLFREGRGAAPTHAAEHRGPPSIHEDAVDALEVVVGPCGDPPLLATLRVGCIDGQVVKAIDRQAEVVVGVGRR